MYVAEFVYEAFFSAFVLNLSKSDNILFRKMPNGIYASSSASLLLLGEITHWSMNFE